MNQLTTELRAVAKALVAGASVTIATAIGIAGDGINLTDALILAGAFLAGAFPTWAVPNTTPPQTRNDAGQMAVTYALAIIGCVIVGAALYDLLLANHIG